MSSDAGIVAAILITIHTLANFRPRVIYRVDTHRGLEEPKNVLSISVVVMIILSQWILRILMPCHSLPRYFLPFRFDPKPLKAISSSESSMRTGTSFFLLPSLDLDCCVLALLGRVSDAG